MSNFIEFKTTDNKAGKILVNKNHITTINPDWDDNGCVLRLNNSLEYHILDKYDTVKDMLNPDTTPDLNFSIKGGE